MNKPPLKEFYRVAKALYLPSILRSLKNRADAEDIFHDMIEKIVTGWDEIKDPERYAWVILKNLKIVNNQTPHHNSIDNLIDFEFNLNLYDNETDAMITSDMFTQAVNSFEPIEKEMLQDFFISGIKYNAKTRLYERMSRDEFCAKHNISLRTLGPALKQLRTEIENIIHGRIATAKA